MQAMTETQALQAEPRSLNLALAYAEPTRLQAMKLFAGTLQESGLMPAHLRTWQQTFAVLVMADSLQIHPWTAITTCYVVHGKVGCEAKLILALIQRTGELEEFSLEGNAEKARCIMKRRGQKPVEAIITMEMARKARWTASYDREKKEWVEKQAWAGMPDLMLKNRALTRVARIAFSDVVLGMYAHDELDIPVRIAPAGEVEVDPDVVTVEPEPTEKSPTKEIREEERAAKASPTEEQRGILSMLFGMKGKDGKPYVGTADRKKWSAAIAQENSESMFSAAIDACQAIVTEAKDREGQGGLHESPPIAEGRLPL